MTTQRYDIPSGHIGNQFVGIILVDLDRIWNHQWNAERVLIFQTVILQRVSGVSESRNIPDPIESQINLWKKGDYDELV